jgi:hypothetical protein
MANADRRRILTINAGSASLKAAVYHMNRTERLIFAVQVDPVRVMKNDEDLIIARHMRRRLSRS